MPFCESKCSYCDFASFVCGEDLKQKYFAKLVQEICGCKYKDREVQSVYFGGGTPSSVDEKYIISVMKCLRHNFTFSNNAEITIECNPASESLDKLKKYRELGINRISFGVQSLNDNTLKFLNRRHTKKDAVEAIKDAQKAGFENISADLIIGVSESQEDLIDSAKQLLNLGVKHISAYMLQIEEGTPLYNAYQNNNSIVPSEDYCVGMYDRLVVFLTERGFCHYEISNFALPCYQSQHNLGYWRLDDYIGFGLSAHSFVDGVRFANSNNFNDYFEDKNITREVLTAQQKIEEKIMLGLRCQEGVSIKDLLNLGYDIMTNPNLSNFVENGIIILQKNGKTPDKITINPAYYGVSNSIIVKLLP